MKGFISTRHQVNPSDSFKSAGANVVESRLPNKGAPKGGGTKKHKAMAYKY